jgi:uncharacterized NAD(P)/FAD-binding protein YdhS
MYCVTQRRGLLCHHGHSSSSNPETINPLPASLDQQTPVVAIVGAGFSGTLVACQLLRLAQRPLTILLLDRSQPMGLGLAYGTNDPGHLLNVSAGAMSAWPEDPSPLLRWLDLNRDALSADLPERVDAGYFLPRFLYGLYLRLVLREAESRAGREVSLRHLQAEVIATPIGAWLDLESAPTTALGLWRQVRRRAEAARQASADWRPVIDGLRPVTARLWQGRTRRSTTISSACSSEGPAGVAPPTAGCDRHHRGVSILSHSLNPQLPHAHVRRLGV